MSELVSADDAEPTPASTTFELNAGKDGLHVRGANVSERVQLSIIRTAGACVLGVLAVCALSNWRASQNGEQGDPGDH
ncbi:hypothetical protein [Streptomyces sp. NPDC090021]|uniref:hypothetical protein n=1 Tax=Streptomyces sp. NPDC090021 TaxID=3365919 RepID=UPI0037F30DB4